MTRTAKLSILGAMAVVCAVAALVATLALQSRAEDAAGVGSIKDSYAFDVTDKRQLMDYAEAAFIGEVIGKEGTDEAYSTTVWRVSVKNAIKGQPQGEVLVRQLGYVDSDGRAHVTEKQPMLVDGRKYLLVTTVDETGQHTLVAGPAASVPAETAAEEASVVDVYQAASRR